MTSDEAYINRVLDGDPSGFAPLMERYSRPVFALLVRMTSNRADAEELAQDAFLKAFRSLRSFRHDCSFATWIYRIAYNTAISALRRTRPDRPAADEEAAERFPIRSTMPTPTRRPPKKHASCALSTHSSSSAQTIAHSYICFISKKRRSRSWPLSPG